MPVYLGAFRKSDMATIIALGVTRWLDTPGVSSHSVTPRGPPAGAARVAPADAADADQSQLGLRRAVASAMPQRHAGGPAEDYPPPRLARKAA
jgi:hypothetical protein